MRIEGLIFDVGGTLIFSDRGRLETADAWAATHFLRTLGYDGEPDRLWTAIVEHRRRGREQAPRQALAVDAIGDAAADCGLPLSDEQRRAAEHVFFGPDRGAVVAIPGMAALVAELASRVRVAVLSNATSHAFIEDVLTIIGLAGVCDPVMTSALAGWRKPHAAGFQRILDTWGLAPGQVVMVGDDPAADIGAATALGMHAVWFGADAVGEPPPDCAVARDAADLRRCLAALGLAT